MRALLLAPHNDDETLFASFTCLRYRPHVVVCFKSYVNGVPAETREAETAAAMKILGCSWTQWPLSDVGALDEEVEAFMWGLRDPDDWELVFAPYPHEHGNLQHALIARLADTVFHDVPIRNYLSYAGGVKPRHGEEVAYEPGWLFLKHAALACYRSAADTPSHRHFAEDLSEWLA